MSIYVCTYVPTYLVCVLVHRGSLNFPLTFPIFGGQILENVSGVYPAGTRAMS